MNQQQETFTESKKHPLYYQYGEFIYRGRHVGRIIGAFRLYNDFSQRIADFKTPQELDAELTKQEKNLAETIIK